MPRDAARDQTTSRYGDCAEVSSVYTSADQGRKPRIGLVRLILPNAILAWEASHYWGDLAFCRASGYA
jgi:hypothetical protein